MKVEEIARFRVELDADEHIDLNEAIRILTRIKETMEKYNCNHLMCCDEYTYDISDLKSTIGTLEMFYDISEIFC